jgi:hypothetical protein
VRSPHWRRYFRNRSERLDVLRGEMLAYGIRAVFGVDAAGRQRFRVTHGREHYSHWIWPRRAADRIADCVVVTHPRFLGFLAISTVRQHELNRSSGDGPPLIAE